MIPAEGEEDRNRHGNRGGRTGGVWELLRGRMLGVWRALGVSAVGEGEAWVRLYPTCDVLLASPPFVPCPLPKKGLGVDSNIY